MSSDYGTVADQDTITKTVKSLEDNGFKVIVVEDKKAAKDTVINIIPKKSEVFTNTSVTLDEAGIAEVLNDSDDYVSLRKKMMQLYGDPTKRQEMKQITSSPDYTLGSAHAVTGDGKIMIASATGSQFPGEAYGAEHVIFVVGAQKLVKDIPDGLNRIETYSVPREDARAQKAYGRPTVFSKLLILRSEPQEGRTTVIIIKENIGF